MKALILRFDAPMISFGSVIVDHHGFTDFFPGLSMITGLIANALGWHHSEFDKLQDLQSRIDFAARWDVLPTRVIDYHTVDLGSPKMCKPGWTTRGVEEHRSKGSSAVKGTHQRYRHYLIDGLMTMALGITGDGLPNLDDVSTAIERPARPLFFGRKTCLPARPLLDPKTPRIQGDSLLSILDDIPVWDRAGETQKEKRTLACWSPDEKDDQQGRRQLVYDTRDWYSQLPSGARWRAEGMIGGAKNGTSTYD